MYFDLLTLIFFKDLEVAFLERLGTLEDDSEYGSDIVENNLLLRLIISLLTGYYTDHIIKYKF